MQLTPCPECDRHVRAGEPACPFCGHVPAAPFLAAPAPRTPGRLGRAAIFAFRVGVIGATGASSGCGSATGLLDPEPRADASVARVADAGDPPAPSLRDAGRPPRDEDGGGSVALYGGPGIDPEPFDASGPDDGGIQALYGGPGPVPVPLDAGMDEDAGGGNINLYGGPPAA